MSFKYTVAWIRLINGCRYKYLLFNLLSIPLNFFLYFDSSYLSESYKVMQLHLKPQQKGLSEYILFGKIRNMQMNSWGPFQSEFLCKSIRLIVTVP